MNGKVCFSVERFDRICKEVEILANQLEEKAKVLRLELDYIKSDVKKKEVIE